MADISKIQTNGNTYDVKDATARETAESKVSSVNIGTVTTGDEPSVTNSGTDKDVVMDFVFPSGGGDSPILTGAVEAGGTLRFTGECVLVAATDIRGDGTYGCWLGAGVSIGSLVVSPGSPLFEGTHDEWILTDTYGYGLNYTIIGATLVG